MNLWIEGIISLDFCFSTTAIPNNTSSTDESFVVLTLPYLLPSLWEVDFTNIVANSDTIVKVCENCSRLENITIHTNKTLNLDSYAMLDLEDTEDAAVLSTFLFYKCSSTVLERVSMRKATYWKYGSIVIAIPQTALIKFIRNAPPHCVGSRLI